MFLGELCEIPSLGFSSVNDFGAQSSEILFLSPCLLRASLQFHIVLDLHRLDSRAFYATRLSVYIFIVCFNQSCTYINN